MTALPDEIIAASGFAAGPPGIGSKVAVVVIANAEREFGPVQPVAILEYEPWVLRGLMAEGNQPPASIDAMERALAENPGWVFYEIRFLVRSGPAHANPRAYVGGAAGRRQ